jgi:hypothetical protein
MTAWLLHPVRAVLDWLGGLVIDHVFLSADRQREIAADNERAAKEDRPHPLTEETS